MATVVRTSGSTYRRAGARMLIDDSGETFGLVSGGCLEAEVSKHAAETLRSGRPELLAFDTRAQLGCRGTVEILVEAFAEKSAEQLFSTARGCFQQRRTLIGATLFGDDEPSDISFGSYPISTDGIHALAATELPEPIIRGGQAALEADRILTRRCELHGASSEALFHPLRPPLQLYVFGAGPDALPVCAFAAQLGWKVTLVIHPSQSPPAVDGRYSIYAAGPEEIVSLSFDQRTAAVVMTHNYGRDLAYLARLLPLRLPYLGLLGPRNRRESLLGDLTSYGTALDEASLASLYSPIGLNIGADTPDEIALSILAEIKAVFASRRAGFLRDSRAPIHATEVAALASPVLT
ncbi:xanthine/CO dehydrogenase XdhC/CoxF family maturation factor [Chthoniobacter flavus]|nr:xanthine/CO dehydrogenase XdhC/CoxF family maturation factor [Chthoniobacter flavus]